MIYWWRRCSYSKKKLHKQELVDDDKNSSHGIESVYRRVNDDYHKATKIVLAISTPCNFEFE